MLFAKQYAEYDPVYSATHYCHGALIGLLGSTILFWWAFIYQSVQYLCDIRIYIPRKEILTGHNLKHLLNKISEYTVGFVLVTVAMWCYN